MAKFIKLTKSQKDEIRRLTQFANRRIKAAQAQYKKQGLEVLPRDVVGDMQHHTKFHTEKQPLSRSVKFQSEREYKKRLSYLRSFQNIRPTITQHGKIMQEKTKMAIESSIGRDLPPELENKLNKMNSAELDRFWTTFDDKAQKKGIKYSSDVVMLETMNELFEEDINSLLE